MAAREDTVPAALGDLNGGKVFDAIDRLKRITQNSTESGSAYFYLSRIYTEMGELEVAERYLDRAISENPDLGPYYYQRAVIRQRQKKWREALTLLEQALKLGVGGDEAAVWRNIGNVQVELFERDEALEAYETALRIQPTDARTLLALGQFFLERNAAEDAVMHLRAAADIELKLPGALASLGRAYRRIGDSSSAVAVLERAVQLDASDQESRYSLGQLLLETGRNDEGRKNLETYRQIAAAISQADRDYDEAMKSRASGDLAAAQKQLEQVLSSAPSYGRALTALGSVLLQRNKPKEAEERFRRAVALNPVGADNHFGLGTAYLRDGKLADALEETRRATVLDDRDARYRRQMAEILTRMGRIQEARAESKTADELELR